jgi:hypothetical protein
MKLTYFVLLLMFLSGCIQPIGKVDAIVWSGVKATVTINNISKSKFDSRNLLIYGNLLLSGFDESVKTINLNCISIRYNQKLSDSIYIDNVAHVLTRSYPVKNGEVEAHVYWLIKDDYLDKESRFGVELNKITNCLNSKL